MAPASALGTLIHMTNPEYDNAVAPATADAASTTSNNLNEMCDVLWDIKHFKKAPQHYMTPIDQHG